MNNLISVDRELTVLIPQYQSHEIAIIERLQFVDGCEGFRDFGYKSLTRYAIDRHGLCEDRAWVLIAIARTSRIVPALLEGIAQGELSISHGLVMGALLKSPDVSIEEKVQFVDRSKELSVADLRDEIAEKKPDIAAADSERIRRKTKNLTSVTFLVTQEEKQVLDRLKSVTRSPKLKAALLKAARELLEGKDPIRKAERAEKRKNSREAGEGQGTGTKEGQETENRERMFSDNNARDRVVGSPTPTTVMTVTAIAEVTAKSTVAPSSSLASSNSSEEAAAELAHLISDPENLEIASSPGPLSRTSSKEAKNFQDPKNPSDQRTVVASVPGKFTRYVASKIPAATLHQVHLKYRGKCGYLDPGTQKRCNSDYYTEIHHRRPLSEGGNHDLSNLILLCHEHHRLEHHHRQPSLLTGHWVYVTS